MRLEGIVKHPAYPFAAAGASLAIGVGVGLLVDFISRKRAEKGEACTDEDWWEDAYDKDDDGDSYPETYPPVPEGVNELPPESRQTSDLFVKPDISKAVDYSRFHEKRNAAAQGLEVAVEEEKDPSVYEVIDEAEFVKESGNGDGYATVTGTYFTQDRILAGWNEDLDEKSVAETVGSEAISRFDDPEVRAVYVRNARTKVLFEVIRSDDPYEEAVAELHIPGDDPDV